jgi:hypothetical protein
MLRVLLAIAVAATQPATDPLTLELRVFNGRGDVTSEARVAVYRAGERSDPLAPSALRLGSITLQVPAGFYDVQAIWEKDGHVIGIRWAERLVVMAYPDEGGRHLEVINLRGGFGALQVRGKAAGPLPDVALYVSGVRDKEAAARLPGTGYALFVVPAGTYDVFVRDAPASWHTQIEVPVDRTRLWIPR